MCTCVCVCSVHTTGRLTKGQGRRRHLCGKQLAFLPSVERRRQSKEGAQPHGHEQGAEDRHHGSQSQAPLGLHHVDLTCTEDRSYTAAVHINHLSVNSWALRKTDDFKCCDKVLNGRHEPQIWAFSSDISYLLKNDLNQNYYFVFFILLFFKY